MSAVDPLEQFLVAYGPEQLQDITVHDREDGSAVIETVSYRPIRVFEKQSNGSLLELFGQAKADALDTFWQDVAAFNQLNNIPGGND
ncbi:MULTISPECIES: hypothetical protein [unclassified Streptomyces]|uniref:hypothetical protein n=1 Tax=unclassified Streptomyces TaxID=2593676 RepID=UPI0036F99485